MKQKDIIQIERKIAIGMIVSSQFIAKVKEILDISFVQSKEAKIIMGWCLEFFNEFKVAPNKDIENLYLEKIRETNTDKDTAQIIEQILDDLSDEYERDSFNVAYLMKQATQYCKACKLNEYADQIKDQVTDGDILEAEAFLSNYKPVQILESGAVQPLGSIQQYKNAFLTQAQPIIKYPGDLGDLVNTSMVSEGFVTLLAQNKGGKSFFLMKSALIAAQQNKNVAFFQAGDMSQSQQERRIAISLARRSDLSKYTKKLYIPILDCLYNQTGECDLPRRECNLQRQDASYIFTSKKEIDDADGLMLQERFNEYPQHIPCYNCKRYRDQKRYRFKGRIWYKEKPACAPLTWKMAYKIHIKKYAHILTKIKLITYPSETLTMSKIYAELDIMEKMGFIADVIIIDYLDLCAPDTDTKTLKPRDQENKKWQRARQISQEKKTLVLSASQSDADGFNTKWLNKRNFSEDRRKLDHVSAMFGINMNNKEKVKGVMRFNDIVGRETEGAGYVNIFHRLQIGQPILGSFY